MSKPSAVKTRILQVASRLFYKQGYALTGVNQLIEEAAIAKASFYKYFPAKSDLLYAYVLEKDKAWFAALEEKLSLQKTAKDKILGIFDFRLERQDEQDYGGCAFVKLSAEISADDQAVSELIRQHKVRLQNRIVELLGQHEVATGGSVHKEVLGQTIYFLMEGATVDVRIKKKRDSLVQAKKIVGTLF